MSSPILAFATVFLSLTFGEHPIEVLVAEPVARVEMLLDGDVIGVLESEPWRLQCDFGQSVAPHRLEAVAFDAEGEEIARAVQWINLPRPSADATVVIRTEDDGSRYAELSWTNILRAPPERISVSFDGLPLTVTDPQRILLPEHDLAQLHFISAELEFAHGVSTLVEVTFGGEYSDEVSAELTAVPIALERGARQPAPAEIETSLLSSTKGSVRVAAVEKGPAEIVIIRDQEVQPALDALARQRRSTRRQLGVSAYAARFEDRLKVDQNIGLFWPFMELSDSGIWMFPPTYGWLSPRDGGVGWLLSNFKALRRDPAEQQLADAVAVAGLNALARNRRRAVVLVLGEAPSDSSRIAWSKVIDYLRLVRVPLYVWSPFEHPGDSPWGEIEDVSTPTRFRAAVDRLSTEIDRQRIVWIEGRHLPQEIEMAVEPTRFSIPQGR
jgi:hypothetical protein